MMDMPRNKLAQEEKTPLAKPKGTVKTIECPDTGETIHCVDILRQPSYDHPLLKNHILRIKPKSSQKSYEALVSEGKFVQAWWKYGECPEGTVPIAASKGTPTLKKSHPSLRFNK
ncbi:uncharacterized protein LOC115683983 [Syzygium oleosum]|uniref:uncharacterized protein LOC115683983 n=1 Tax=Syzygium oleosum TaxID=219896 RepID=UPI0011D2A522|nr:uncharacterized protein LOC115683983 [Syzygium oleosum]